MRHSPGSTRYALYRATAVLLASSILIACAPRRAESEIAKTEFVLGTVCTLRLAKGGSDKVLDEAFARLRQIEDELSVNKPGSHIDAVNEAAGRNPVRVDEDAFAILERDLSYAAMSEGAFDPSVGPLVRLWAIGTERERVPSREEIGAALALVGWKNVILDGAARTVFLKKPGMALDLGSGTKGYATDEVVKIFRTAGVKSAIIDLGGNIYALGKKTDGKSWRIGLQDPESDRGSYLGIASLSDRSMVTSGVYERYFMAEGKRYHHILDTKNGFPVDNGLLSVSIVADRSFDADGLTTTVFALGREKGMELARRRGVDAILVDRDRKVYCSPGVSKYFEITNKDYTLAE
jgi:thiamine biosynthesis lipoprotein